MIGKMIKRVRKEKGMTKTKLSELTDINISHMQSYENTIPTNLLHIW